MDAMEIERIADSIERYGDRFLRHVFTEGEIAYCRRKRDFASSFAARFAAKEAAMKALGTGFSRGVYWLGIEVVRHHGPPRLQFHAGALARFTRARRHEIAPDAHPLARALHRARPADARLSGGGAQPRLPSARRAGRRAVAPQRQVPHCPGTSRDSPAPAGRARRLPPLRTDAEDAMEITIVREREHERAGRQAGRRRAALHRRRPRGAEADRLRHLGEPRGSGGRLNVTFPARQYSVNGERRSVSRCCGRSPTARRRTACAS